MKLNMEKKRRVLRTVTVEELTGEVSRSKGKPEFDFSRIVRRRKESLRNQKVAKRGYGYEEAGMSSGGRGKLFRSIRSRMRDLLR